MGRFSKLSHGNLALPISYSVGAEIQRSKGSGSAFRHIIMYVRMQSLTPFAFLAAFSYLPDLFTNALGTQTVNELFICFMPIP